MKQLNTTLFVLAIAALFFASSCKKDTTPQVYFTASSATVNQDGSATVSVQLSEPTTNVVEIGFQSVGANRILFGSYNGVFMRDDSNKVEASIDANGFIDSLGHLKITPGAKGVLITFKTKGDNFAHAAGNFAIKIVSAQNATIRSGSDTYTYNINSSNVADLFSSTINYVDNTNTLSGEYSLQTYTYTGSGSSYNLILNYGEVTTNLANSPGIPSTLTINYQNLAQFQAADTLVADCNNNTIAVTINASSGNINLSCTDFTTATTSFPVQNTSAPSGAYGNYLVFSNGKINLISSGYKITGTISSQFIHY